MRWCAWYVSKTFLKREDALKYKKALNAKLNTQARMKKTIMSKWMSKDVAWEVSVRYKR